MVRKVVKIAVVISVINVLLAGMAFAEGVGLKLGKGEFHPSIGIVSEYDSNVLYKDADLISDFVLHVEPGFKLTMPGSNFIFDFSGLAVYNKYFKEENSVLSSTEGESGISITFNPRGQYKLKLSNNFIRSSRPRNHSLARNDRIANQAGFKFTYNPAGGIVVIAGHMASDSLAMNLFLTGMMRMPICPKIIIWLICLSLMCSGTFYLVPHWFSILP